MRTAPFYTVAELREVVGPEYLGRDAAYKLARRHGVRLGRRLLLPARVVKALLEGRLDDLEAEKNPAVTGRGD